MNISNALFKMAGRGIITLALILAEARGALRHLEENTSAAPKPALSAPDQPKSEGYVTTQEPPAGLAPAKTLSPQQWRENFDFLCKAIDETCATFEIKSINWDELHHRYQQRLDATTTTEQFYRLLFDLVRELHDGHAWLQNYHPAVPASAPGVTVDLFQDKPFVVAVEAGSEAARLGVKPGSEVLEIDGLSVTNRIERLRTLLHGFSSERGFRRDACRRLLTGEKDSMAVVKLRSPDGQAETFRLPRGYELETPPPQPCPFALTRQRFVHFGRLPSGLGYIRIVSFMGRQEIDDEFDKALEALRAAPGIILDIRDNRGGYGHTHIAGRLLQKPAPGGTSYVKNGPGHKDLERRDIILYPTGPWQYDGPVVLLVNDVTGSASDLFACYLRSAKRVVTVGSTTHGLLSGQAAWAVLPCGLIVRISNSYICDSTGQPIEGRGNEPDVVVRPTITDFLTGKDPVLDKAAALLREKLRRNQAGGLPLPQSLSSPGGWGLHEAFPVRVTRLRPASSLRLVGRRGCGVGQIVEANLHIAAPIWVVNRPNRSNVPPHALSPFFKGSVTDPVPKLASNVPVPPFPAGSYTRCHWNTFCGIRTGPCLASTLTRFGCSRPATAPGLVRLAVA